MAMTIDPWIEDSAVLPESIETIDVDDSQFAEAIRRGRWAEERDAYTALQALS